MDKTEEEALKRQLSALERAQSSLRTTLLGLSLQYRVLDQQKQELLGCPVEGPDTGQLQIGASLIVLCSLFGFLKLSKDTAAQSVEAGVCPDFMDLKLNLLIIMVALIRLGRLLFPAKPAGGTAAMEEEAMEAEEEEEDVLP